ncbi:MAG: sulfatase-like hydrolase/transferase [Verrucomicrobia bacterium]|nr:sulfatase-like hydrolase/transferase [Verrucomicrobiota bacterium]
MERATVSRKILRILAGCGAAAIVCSAAPACRAAAAAERPNFVIILADDMGYGDASCYGNRRFATPHIDRLAAEGARFTDFHSSGPVCSPTRAGLLTGRYQQRAGIDGVINADPKANRHHGLQLCEVTFAELLKRVGYATAVIGKWHLGYEPRYNPLHQGFDEFHGYVSGNIDYISHYDRMGVYDWWDGLRKTVEPGYSTHLITRHAIQFLEAHRNEPFCLYIAHEAVHSPWQGPNDPPVRGPEAAPGRAVRSAQIARAYREMLQEMDKGVGEVMAALKRLGLEKNTLVFFFSDNGATQQGSNSPFRGFKGSLWEGGHRVPAIARWPGRIKPGRIIDLPAISLDIAPTLIELAGASFSKDRPLDGRSLAPLLLKNRAQPERRLFWAFRNYRAMRQGQWKLLVPEAQRAGTAKLFDLSRDPGEKTDLAAKEPARVQAMLKALKQWEADVRSGATPQPARPSAGS